MLFSLLNDAEAEEADDCNEEDDLPRLAGGEINAVVSDPPP